MGVETSGLRSKVIGTGVALLFACCVVSCIAEITGRGAEKANTDRARYLAALWLDIVSGPKNLEPVRNNAPDSPPVIVIPRESPTPTDILGSPKSPIDWMASQTPQP